MNHLPHIEHSRNKILPTGKKNKKKKTENKEGKKREHGTEFSMLAN
jgi:hypothetical protein